MYPDNERRKRRAMSDSSKSEKDRPVCYVCYPWEVTDLATAEKVLPMLERLYHMGYSPIISPVYLRSSGFYTYDLAITFSLIKKCDVVLLLHEDQITALQLRELMKAREFGKRIIRIVKEV